MTRLASIKEDLRPFPLLGIMLRYPITSGVSYMTPWPFPHQSSTLTISITEFRERAGPAVSPPGIRQHSPGVRFTPREK